MANYELFDWEQICGISNSLQYGKYDNDIAQHDKWVISDQRHSHPTVFI